MNGYLVAANVAFWAGLVGYAAFLAVRSRRLSQRVKQLEALSHDH